MKAPILNQIPKDINLKVPNQKNKENHEVRIPHSATKNPPDFPIKRPKIPKYIEVIKGINKDIKCISS